MANTYLSRTQGTGNRKTWTYSVWLKRSILGTNQNWGITQEDAANNNAMPCGFNSSDKIDWYDYNAPSVSGQLITNRVFRDTSAWYHIVLAVDTTNATADDRMKIYVNGVQETSFATRVNPSLNYDFNINVNTKLLSLGAYYTSSPSSYFDGSMSHIHFIDGTAYDATAFGEYDANGVWTIKTSPSVTYGTNGFFILKDGNSVTDQSGNSNNFTVAGGTLTNTEDNPSNVFPTFGNGNIIPNNSTNSFSQGSLTLTNSTDIWQSEILPFAFSSGKYYWEVKLNHNGSDPRIGLGTMNESNFNINTSGNNSFFRNQTGGYGFHSGGSGGDYVYANGSSIGGTQTSNFDAINGTICGIAVDCDNKRMYLSVNGTWENSANPSNGTNPYDVSSGWTTGDLMFPFITTHNSIVDFNFGNGYFGTTAVSSAGTNASGNGIFEYDVPSGYTALSTKGLNL